VSRKPADSVQNASARNAAPSHRGNGGFHLSASDLKLGIIGADTSHVVEFTKLLNKASDPEHVPGARVVIAFAGGSPDISRTRIDGFPQELQNTWHIQFVKQIQDLCPMVDGILIESIDGRAHLDQFRQAVACGKPIRA